MTTYKCGVTPQIRPREILIHFINGLRLEIQRQVKLFALTSIDEARQKIEETEQFVKVPTL